MVGLTAHASYGLIGPSPGIELCLYIRTIHVFLGRRRAPRESDVFYAVFSSVLLLLVTIWVAVDAMVGQRVWLLSQNYPGGPVAYGEAHASDTYIDVGAAAAIVLQQMTDILMVRPGGRM